MKLYTQKNINNILILKAFGQVHSPDFFCDAGCKAEKKCQPTGLIES